MTILHKNQFSQIDINKIKEVNLKIAFKKKNKDTGIFGKSISLITNSKYYHVELIIDNLWVSADAPMGVTVNDLLPLDHENWDYVDLGNKIILEEDYKVIMNYIESLKGKKYDYLAILFSQLIPLNIHSPNKVFCSEVITTILKLFLVDEVISLIPNNVSPKDLARIFNLKG